MAGRIPVGLLPNGCKWTAGMMGAINQFKRQVKRTRRREGKVAAAALALQFAGAIAENWDDGTWFEMWASTQAPGKEEMMSWAEETMEAGPHSDYERCRAAFFTCVYLELMGWDVA